MSDYDGLNLCEVCRDRYTLGRLCESCGTQEQIDNGADGQAGNEGEERVPQMTRTVTAREAAQDAALWESVSNGEVVVLDCDNGVLQGFVEQQDDAFVFDWLWGGAGHPIVYAADAVFTITRLRPPGQEFAYDGDPLVSAVPPSVTARENTEYWRMRDEVRALQQQLAASEAAREQAEATCAVLRQALDELYTASGRIERDIDVATTDAHHNLFAATGNAFRALNATDAGAALLAERDRLRDAIKQSYEADERGESQRAADILEAAYKALQPREEGGNDGA